RTHEEGLGVRITHPEQSDRAIRAQPHCCSDIVRVLKLAFIALDCPLLAGGGFIDIHDAVRKERRPDLVSDTRKAWPYTVGGNQQHFACRPVIRVLVGEERQIDEIRAYLRKNASELVGRQLARLSKLAVAEG